MYRWSGHTSPSAIKQRHHPAGHTSRQLHPGCPLRPRQAQGNGAQPLLVGGWQAAHHLCRLGCRALQRRWQNPAQPRAGRRHQLPFSVSQGQVRRHAVSNEGLRQGPAAARGWTRRRTRRKRRISAAERRQSGGDSGRPWLITHYSIHNFMRLLLTVFSTGGLHEQITRRRRLVSVPLERDKSGRAAALYR